MSSNFRVGGNCHITGPSFGPSSVMPELQKAAMDSPASARSRRCVVKRDALTANTKPSGTVSRHFAKLSGFCRP